MANTPRTFALCSPHLHGDDVTDFQHLLNSRFKSWEIDHRIATDGEYGQATRAAAKTVAFGLGIAEGPINAHGVTPNVRTLIRHPDKRNRTELKRGADRVDWRRRLRARYAKSGPDMFVAYLEHLADLHVTEQPAGSNLGPYITDMERLCGYDVPAGGVGVYWCGCLQNAALVAAGFASMPWMGYCPSLEAHARAGTDGWKWHAANATPKRGWIALFTEGGIAGHMEGVVKDGKPLRSIGGNTSAGNGSANNGGGIYRHDFSTYKGLPLRGFAEPPYHS
jgi:hypothetical protein